jgi:2-polyprenyl-3-methyl-5-hydroxy-6-metoxy-1,4-benzoquinol methylase
MHPKSFYHNYQAANQLFEIDDMLIKKVLSVNPTSVFDFGTGTGKNIAKLLDINQSISVAGMDMSFLNIIHARAKNELPFLMIGDEYHLCRLRNFDVVMTCSVLCHIENIQEIVSQFKQIAKSHIIIAETNDVVGEFYYPHDYEAMGFVPTGAEWLSTTGALYKIYSLTI